MPEYEPDVATEMESRLDLILEALAAEADDDTEPASRLCSALSQAEFERGHFLEGLMWRAIAGDMLERRVTVAQFRTLTRRNLEKLARQS